MSTPIDQKKKKSNNDWPAFLNSTAHNVWKVLLLAYVGANYLVQSRATPREFEEKLPTDINGLPYKGRSQEFDLSFWPMHRVGFPYTLCDSPDSYLSGVKAYLSNICRNTFSWWRMYYATVLLTIHEYMVGDSYWGQLLFLFVWAPLIAAFVMHGSSIVGLIMAFVGSLIQNVDYAWFYALAPMTGVVFALSVVIAGWVNPLNYLVALFGIIPMGFVLGWLNFFWLVGVALALHVYAVGFLLPFGVMYMGKFQQVPELMFKTFRREYIMVYLAMTIVAANSSLDTESFYGVSAVCIAMMLMAVKFLAPATPTGQ
jgi:hypothetical protein